ncbi:MAG: SDR family NAD(P)-dependent oxidoreductase [Gemmatimonadales bacterium]|nr:SDR family NAD(P)-dependent oxidoreductase [Gemmatimonadales bacterium]MDZ4388417.1 SDR family NAD(P)-dependent oxidoreductase [Gemmatimonadales bacterium]
MASILVTGSSRGIGRATALTLGRAGHTVHATMRNPAAATSLAETIAEEGLAVHLSAMDVTIDSSVADGIAAIEAAHGPLDALVNNAGIEHHGSIEELPLVDIRAIMETNYFGALRCIQAVMPSMRARRRGCIVNVTSVAGRISSSPLGAYAASKFALEAASEALAQEAAMFGVRVAIVQPGIINTEMAQAITTEHDTSPYPHARRFGGLFAASLQHPTSPMLVAETIREIVEGDTGRLRHPVGPDAEPFLAWRAAMTDEEWVAWGAAQDEEWYASVELDFGLDARRG